VKLIKKQPFIDYCWRFGLDWSLNRTVGLSAVRRSVSGEYIQRNTQTIDNPEKQTMQNKVKYNYPGRVTFYDTRPVGGLILQCFWAHMGARGIHTV